jgi:hypothetical protein
MIASTPVDDLKQNTYPTIVNASRGVPEGVLTGLWPIR